MTHHKFGIRAVLALAAILIAASRAPAQAPLEPERLPAKTYFYLLWRGAPPTAARQANSLFALWDDPDFAPVRAAMAENLVNEPGKDKSKAALTREQMDEYSALLENPFLIGYYGEPDERRRKGAAAESGDSAAKWNGMFFVYDRTGKEALLAKAIVSMRAQEREPPKLTLLTLAGVSALKVEHKTETSYWAETGKYAVSAGEPQVFEEIVNRLNGKAGGGRSLGELAAFKEAQPQMAKGSVVEFFLRVPSLKELVPAPKQGEMDTRPLVAAINLEAVHALAGSVSLDGPRTRMQGALLGDASAGTLFDIWPNGEANFASAELVPADAVAYSEGRLNALGLYNILERAARSFAPKGQTGFLEVMESAIQSRIGMPLPDALALFTGEFATIQTAADLDDKKTVFALGIQKKPETLKLLRTVLSDRIASERNEGETTFLKISTHGGESGAGTVQWGAYQAAVTPHFLLGAPRSDALRAVLAQSGSASAGFTSQPRYQQARGRYPQTLNGFSFYDFQRIDWDGVKTRVLAEAKKPSKTTDPSTGAKRDPPAQAMPWLEQVNPQVFARHLHTATSASWKDATGLKFDAWFD